MPSRVVEFPTAEEAIGKAPKNSKSRAKFIFDFYRPAAIRNLSPDSYATLNNSLPRTCKDSCDGG